MTDQCGGQWERGWWCSRLTARHGNGCQLHFKMSRSHVTLATTCHTRVIDPVIYCWARALSTVCKLLMKMNVLRMRVSHLYSDIHWPEAATPIMLVTYLLLRWGWKRFVAVNTRGSCGLGQGCLNPNTNRTHIFFTSFLSFQLCDMLRITGNDIAG